jgi:uncharacterized protein
MMSQTLSPARPWYRHRWPWALMVVPVAAVMVGFTMLGIAMRYPDDVVVDTYYKDGKYINLVIALDEEASRRGLKASLSRNPHSESTQIHLNADTDDMLHLFAFHVTDSSEDREFLLVPGAGDSYVSADPALTAILESRGVWYLELRGDSNEWRLRRRVQTPVTELEF